MTPQMEAEAQRHATATAAVLRRHRMLVERMQRANLEEIEHLGDLHASVVRSRMATYHKLEASAIRSATLRARAAKHERKVIAVRTQRVLEDMARHTLSLRLARSSKQAAAASSLLHAYAAQERAAAADQVRAAADDRAAELLRAQASLAAVSHRMAVVAEVVKEETAKQVAQRQAAMRSQREALRRALADMRTDEAALLESVKATQTHAEEAFLAEHVEGLHPDLGRGASTGFDAHGVAHGHVANTGIDIDENVGRVNTAPRVAGVVNRAAVDVHGRIAAARSVMMAAAHDAAQAAAEAEDLARDAGGILITSMAQQQGGEVDGPRA